MNLKILNLLGKIACITIIISCFLPWTFNDVNSIPNAAEKIFTGFFSYQYRYGRPGKFIIFFALIILVFMIIPKIWAKRANIFLSGFLLAYCFKSYILYTGCYDTYCPEKRFGIFLMFFSGVVILISTLFPDMKIETSKKQEIV